MSDPQQELSRLLEGIREGAYRAGWRDAMAKALAVLKVTVEPEHRGGLVATRKTIRNRRSAKLALQTKRIRRPSRAEVLVLDMIKVRQGLGGVELDEAIKATGHRVSSRAVRTALVRLRLAGSIEQRDGKWIARIETPAQDATPAETG